LTEQFANDAVTRLAEDLDTSETVIDVVDGSVFPSVGNFRVKVNREIMICTSRSSNALTVTRGAESTTARQHPTGAEIKHIITAAGLLQSIADGSLYDAYVCIRDEKAQNTDGGTFTNGAWRTRDLNTEHADTHNLASVASNQITLEAGTYRILASAPAYLCGRHKLRIQNITDTTTLLDSGESSYSNNGVANQTHAQLKGRFTIAAQKVLELQHRCEFTSITIGLGVSSNLAAEVYAVVELFREIS
jgi:hypothetical protein